MRGLKTIVMVSVIAIFCDYISTDSGASPEFFMLIFVLAGIYNKGK